MLFQGSINIPIASGVPFPSATPLPEASRIILQQDPNMGNHVANLVNIATLLVLVPVILFFLVFAFIVFNSPAGSFWIEYRANRHYQNENYARAIELYLKLYDFQEYLGAEDIARQLAYCYEELGEYENAIHWYEKVPDWGRIGQLYIENKQPEKAVIAFKNGRLYSRLAQYYENIQDYFRVGELYEVQLQNQYKARMYYEKAMETIQPTDDNWARLHLYLGRVYLRLGRNEDAQRMRKLIAEQSSMLNNQPELQESFHNLERGLNS